MDEAVQTGADLIVAHHPVMNCTWHPVQTLRTDDRQGRILTGLVENHISAICMHTNLDAADGGVNDALAEKLGLLQTEYLTDEKNWPRGHIKMPNTPCGVHPVCGKIIRMQWVALYGLRQTRTPCGGGRRCLRRIYRTGYCIGLRYFCHVRSSLPRFSGHKGAEPHRRRAFSHGTGHCSGTVPAATGGIFRSFRFHFDLASKRGHPILHLKERVNYVRTFQVAQYSKNKGGG